MIKIVDRIYKWSIYSEIKTNNKIITVHVE